MNTKITFNNIAGIGNVSNILELEIRPLTLLIGPNGSGKSSFLKILSNSNIEFLESISKDNFFAKDTLNQDSQKFSSIKIKNDFNDIEIFTDLPESFYSSWVSDNKIISNSPKITSYLSTYSNVNYDILEKYEFFSQDYESKNFYTTNDKEYHDILKVYNFQSQKDYLLKILKFYKIAENILIEKQETVLFVYIIKNGNKINLNNLPRGYKKLFFLILFIINKSNRYIYDIPDLKFDNENRFEYLFNLIIEEPESNLHPNLQSKLYKLFMPYEEIYYHLDEKLISQNILVETHSEYLIRSFQKEVALGNISTDDICIIYFEANNENLILPRMIYFDENGYLSEDFGKGFMDEASHLIHDLRKIRMENNN